MSDLTNLQINQSYQGVINLYDAGVGLTDNLQAMTDGEGRTMPVSVSQTRFVSNNLISYKPFIPDYTGNGFGTTEDTPIVGSEAGVIATLFYEPSFNGFSGISMNVLSASSTDDEVYIAFYDTQFVNGIGLAPKDYIFEVGPIPVSGTGVSTISFGPFNFYNNGSGLFFAVMRIRNATNVTPTVVFANKPNTGQEGSYNLNFGYVLDNTGTKYQNAWKNTNINDTGIYFSNTDWLYPYTESDIINTIETTAVTGFGFVLHTEKY